MKKIIFPSLPLFFITALGLAFSGCGNRPAINEARISKGASRFYSEAGREAAVSFNGTIRTRMTSLQQVQKLSEDERERFLLYNLPDHLQFLYGPLTERSIGSPKKGQTVKIAWEQAFVENGRVFLPFSYNGVWFLDKKVVRQGSFDLPVPFAVSDLMTPRWKNCTDSAPDHQTESFYWYFWDPARYGCDHALGREYQIVKVEIGAQTANTVETYPEYDQLLQSAGIKNNLQMTFAFGYVEDVPQANPETDRDPGMKEYRKFVKEARKMLGGEFQMSTIFQNEYPGAERPEAPVGKRFVGTRNGVKVTVNIVTAGEIDQMDVFAKSFAHDHDGFFAWMGHSRVGSGFDARRFAQIVARNPSFYSISSNYQLVYWGGCNSYSYYTVPFFQMKATASNGADPNGTKGLDILANGLPSLFSFNSENSLITLKAILNWEQKTSYQRLVTDIENYADQNGRLVLVGILGDEDNL